MVYRTETLPFGQYAFEKKNKILASQNLKRMCSIPMLDIIFKE